MEIMRTIALMVASAGIGAYLNHKFSVKQEKRKEFNLISEPILEQIELIEKILSNKPNANNRIYFEHRNVDLIKRRISDREFNKLLSVIDEYNEVASYVIKNPAPYFGQPDGEWIDKYDEAMNKLHKLKKNFKLK